MTPYICLSETESGEPLVVVGELGDFRDEPVEVDWPANARGFRNAGRHVWLAYAQDGYTHSSTLDFPAEYGVALDSEEIHGLILAGIEEARKRDG